MPSPAEILAGLGRLANDWQWLAITWHVYFGLGALALVAGVRPSGRTAGALLALPLLSVSALAWTAGNPFNGTLFAVVGLALLVLALRLSRERVRPARAWAVVSGALLFAFGWVYPHFLEGTSAWTYLYAAPAGLIPCPTLSAVIGLALALDELGARPWPLLLGLTGLFYGVFGALRLGVTIDLVLLVGALALLGGKNMNLVADAVRTQSTRS